MSKTTAIGLIILFSAIIAGGVLYLAWKDSPKDMTDQFPSTPTKPFQPTQPGSPQIPTADLVQLTESSVTSFAATESGVRFIERSTGNILESNNDGSTYTTLSSITIPYTFNALWSFDRTKTILWYRESEQVKIASVELGKQTKGVLLPAEVLSADYSPDRNRIFYTIRTGDTLTGIAANPDNTNQSKILTLPYADFRIEWFTPREISFLLRPTGLADGFLYRYNIDTQSFDRIIGELPGLDVKWSQDGSRIIYSIFNTQTRRPQLYLYDIKKSSTTDLSIETFAQKCAWLDKDDALCAIPNSIEKGTYPDDWFKGKAEFNDVIAHIYTTTNEKTVIKNLPLIDVELLEVSLDKKYVYIKNKKDGTLWSLQLVSSE